MSEPFYIVAVYATKIVDDRLQIATGVTMVHPWIKGDAQRLASASAELTYPVADGWEDHFTVIQPLDLVLTETIAAEAGLALPEHSIVATVLLPSRVEPEIEDEP